MPKYKCPIETCNVSFEGAVYEIIPRAIGHADGSHRTVLSDNDVIEIIADQAMPKPEPVVEEVKEEGPIIEKEEVLPENEEEEMTDEEVEDAMENDAQANNDWWKK